jgi:hypothetical protein
MVGQQSRLVLGFVLAAAGLSWAIPGNARAETTCQWAGSPTKPTGVFTISPGLTNVPAGAPAKFKASGQLTGDDPRCHGQTMTWVGQIDAGSTCPMASFEGNVKGLAGVATYWGRGSLLVPSYLYDGAGNLVGVENAQIVTQDNLPRYGNCIAPGGFTYANFSSTVVLF